MKFRDIKQFPRSTYSVDVDWSHLKNYLQDLKENEGVNLNPIYQRGYVWTERQKTEYLEHILRGGFSGRDIFWNSANWQSAGETGVLELVDGQQRVKTVLQFLDNKVPIFDGYYFQDFTDRMRTINARFRSHINNLPTQLEVVEWYLGMNKGGSIHTEEDLKPAYDYRNELLNK